MQDYNVPLVTFGCSWTQCFINKDDSRSSTTGQESIGYFLSQSLRSSHFVNMGIEGSSNSRSVMQLLNYVKQKQVPVKGSIAVFLLTGYGRESIIVDPMFRYKDSIIDLRSGVNDPHVDAWLKFFTSYQNLMFNFHRNLLAMQTICAAYQISDYYVGTFEDLILTYPLDGVDTRKIYPQTCVQILGYENGNDYRQNFPGPYVLACGHPNKLGNQLIAQTIHQWISNTNHNEQFKIPV